MTLEKNQNHPDTQQDRTSAVPLPCQQAMLAACETIHGMRVYRCGKAVFVISGRGPDSELLELACEGCQFSR